MAPSALPALLRSWTGTLPAAPAVDVLAGIAAAVGVDWDGPGDPVPVRVPELPGWLLLDAAREALLEPGERRRLGAHHTPPDLAARLVQLALDGVPPGAVVLDPACGGGAFLVAAADQLVASGARPETVVRDQVRGIDVDPAAAATTRAALRCWATARGVAAPEPRVEVGDALATVWTAGVVVGNPPFLSPLGRTTAGGPAAAGVRRRLGAPYADVSGLFLLRALESVPDGGRVVLIQPESMLSSRDAGPVRDAVAPSLVGLWSAGAAVFGRAATPVCAPVLHKGGGGRRVARWTGPSARRAASASRPGAGSTWAGFRQARAPRPRQGRGGSSGGTVGDLATATAGFRDQFYGLAAAVTDGGTGLPVVTCGLLDPGRCAWGERPARIGGRRYRAPTVDAAALDPHLREWVQGRLVAKVLVATQTKVVEAVPDPDGRLVPLTPVVAVAPHDPEHVWRLAAALLSPAVSAWALHHHGGAALAPDAIKLSARQVLSAPLPGDGAAWDDATDALRAGDVAACGAALALGDDLLLRWWLARLPATARPERGAGAEAV